MKHCAVITGASTGIGEAFAYELAKHGYNILLLARRVSELERVAKNIKNLGVDVDFKKMDISLIQDRDEVYEYINTHHEIDLLVNNAGFGLHGVFTDIDRHKQIRMINTNITGLHDFSYLMLEHMKYSHKIVDMHTQYIVNISSVGAFQPGPFYATYYASKAFVLSFSEALSEELYHTQKKSPHNIHVSAVCPGPINTEFFQHAGIHNNKNKAPSAEALARYAISRVFRKKTIIIYGNFFKLWIFFQRFISRKFIRYISAITQKSRLKSNN